MTSRDKDYLTLRNLQCYEATDGSYVTPGYVLTAGVRGQGVWTNAGATGATGPFGESDKGDTGTTGPANDVGTAGPIGYSDAGSMGTSGLSGPTGSIGMLAPITEGVATIPASTQTFSVSDASVTANSMIVVFPLNWDHVLTNIEVYPNPGSGFTIVVSPALLLFDTPGTTYPVSVSSATPITFEMIGAGGSGNSGGVGGGGGYIQGTITLPPGTTQIKVVVGGVGGGPGGSPSGASYITIPGTGPLFAIAGAGGASDGFFITAGWGGGGAFTSNVEPGGDAFGGSGVGGGGGSQASSTQGGFAGTECGFVIPGDAGDNAGSSGLYEQALGGSSPSSGMTPGGSGYAGGGSGCGGGGGSSFVNSTYVSVSASVAGNALTTELPGFGRSNQGGYVSISPTWPAIDVRWWILRY